MAKTVKKFVSNPDQMNLFDLMRHEHAERSAASTGKLCVSARLQAAVKADLKSAPKSRETIADEMSHLTGQEVSVHMINSWVAESHPHRLPAELIPALCAATGSTETIRVLADATGLYTLPAPDALRSEIQKLDEESRRIRSEIHKRQAFLREIEGAES